MEEKMGFPESGDELSEALAAISEAVKADHKCDGSNCSYKIQLEELLAKQAFLKDMKLDDLHSAVTKNRTNFTKELDSVTERWSKTNLLDGINDKMTKQVVAMMLENQKLMNEMSTETEGAGCANFKKPFIDLVSKVYRNIAAHKLVSVQPLMGPVGLAYYTRYYQKENNELNLCIESEEIIAKTRRLETSWSFEQQQDLKSVGDANAEDLLLDDLAEKIVAEYDREILTDLHNNAGTISVTNVSSTPKEQKNDSVHVKILEMVNVVHRKCLSKPNWVVVTPKFLEKYPAALAKIQDSGINVYVSDAYEQIKVHDGDKYVKGEDNNDTALIGHRGDSYLAAGYVYSPYVPFTLTPAVLDPNSFVPRRGLMTRYGKKLLREGAKHYARLRVVDET